MEDCGWAVNDEAEVVVGTCNPDGEGLGAGAGAAEAEGSSGLVGLAIEGVLQN